jgi:hypothetical protein
MSNREKIEDLNVNSSSWHFRVYEIAVAMWCKWTGKSTARYEHVNLCTYVRMITVYFPMMIGIFAVILTSLVWIPMIMVDWYGINPAISALWTTAQIIGFILAIVFAIVTILFMWSLLAKVNFTKVIKSTVQIFFIPLEKTSIEPTADTIVDAPKTKNFFEIFCQWWNDKHAMVCRPMTIIDDIKSGVTN